MKLRRLGGRWQPAALAVIASLCAGCLSAPERREDCAEQMDPVQIAKRAFGEKVNESGSVAQPLSNQQPESVKNLGGPLRKESLGTPESGRVGRGFEEDGPSGSRRNFIDMYSGVLKEKAALEIENEALKKRITLLEAEVEKLQQEDSSAERTLQEAVASQKLLEEALAGEQKKAEEMYNKFVAAEELRLKTEIDVVRLQHELVKNGIAVPSDLVSVKDAGK